MVDGLRFAVAGYGQIATIHTRRLVADGHHLSWSVGRVPERTEAFARKHDYDRHTTDLERALADPLVDAVVLGTPNALHAPQAAACLEAGKHVLVEIPLAMSFAEGKALADSARRRGLVLMVGHTHRFQGALRRVRIGVERGESTVDSVVARYLLLRRESVGSSGYVRSWTDSLLWHHAQHAVDMALWLLGVDQPGRTRTAAVQSRPDPVLGTPLDLSLLVQTDDGRLATVAMSYNNETDLVCDYVLASRGRTLIVENGVLRDRTGVVYDPRTDPAAADSGVLQNREFVAAVREGRPASVSADDVLPAMEVLQEAAATCATQW